MSVVRQNSRGSDLFFAFHIIAIGKLIDEKQKISTATQKDKLKRI